jgi:DNA-binding transcriptional LysR family regulator
MLDLKLLHQALILARHRNFARAAEALHLTQPALSRSIAGLEAALGEKLFDRTRQGVEPTSFGRMLLARAQPLVDGSAELERDFRLLRGLQIGDLRVGAGAYPAELSVGQAAGQLMNRHPTLRVELSSSDLRSLIAALRERKLDLAVMELSMVEGETDFATEALPEHQGCFFCRAGHPLAQLLAPSLEQVLAYPYVGTRMPRRTGRDFLELARVGRIDADSGDYLPPIKVDSVQVAKDVVLKSDAVGAAPLAMLAPEIRSGRLFALPLRLDWMHTRYGFVYLGERLLSPAAQAFMAEVRTVEAGMSALADSLRLATEPQSRLATVSAAGAQGRSKA